MLVKIVIISLVAFVMSFCLTPVARVVSFKTGVLDIPKDNRRVHKEPMPLLGGVAIYITLFLLMPFIIKKPYELAGIMIGSTIVFVAGVFDDINNMRPRTKFLFQVIAASVACGFGIKIDFITNPFDTQNLLVLASFISIPITIFWITGITNTINLIDGLDGLSTGITMISAITFSIIAYDNGNYTMTLLSVALAGACLGFLPYNFSPASIFVGDGGALLMGFMLSVISIQAVIKSTAALAMIVPILGIAIPILDTSFAIVRRFLNGKKITAADSGHVHHRLLRKGFSQRQTVLILYGISIVYSAIAVILAKVDTVHSLFVTGAIFLITLGLAWKIKIFNIKE